MNIQMCKITLATVVTGNNLIFICQATTYLDIFSTDTMNIGIGKNIPTGYLL
jgi:hypothetical protein